MIEFVIPGAPPTATAQQKGQNRKTGAYYKTPELKDAEAKYMAWCGKNRPDRPLEGPVALTVVFNFPATKTHPDGSYKTTKPDTDNMLKLLKDCLTKTGFWKDDAQVAWELTVKRHRDIPCVCVRIEELPE